MPLSRTCGLIGLPNVGKSTVFNALLTSKMAQTGNYPFCTIKPNIARLAVADTRLCKLQKFSKAAKIIPVEIGLTDIAGLVAGAHRGEGLGNQFLADIRNVSVLLHVLRCFRGDGFLDPTPLSDAHVILQELILSDLALVEKRYARLTKAGSKKGDDELSFIKYLKVWLEEGKPAKTVLCDFDSSLHKVAAQILRELQLLSSKPMIWVLNLGEDKFEQEQSHYREQIIADKTLFSLPPNSNENGTNDYAPIVSLSARLEEEMSDLSLDDRVSFRGEYGLTNESCAAAVTKVVHESLGLGTFFTVGPEMVHAWSFHRGANVRDASGEIHSHFKEHFVAAHTLHWEQYMTYGSLNKADDALLRRDAEYILKDGEVMHVSHKAPKK